MTKDIGHDEAPAIINDHAFEPRAQWWSLCRICGLARAAHSSSTIDVRKAMFADQMARYGKLNYAVAEQDDETGGGIFRGAPVSFGCYSDDNPDDE